jgi:hypothetical protein
MKTLRTAGRMARPGKKLRIPENRLIARVRAQQCPGTRNFLVSEW